MIMGIDYIWAGRASYPRFYNELFRIAKLFGGIAIRDSEGMKFTFPKETDKTLVKWFNNIFGDFTIKETKIIWKHISLYPEIKDISKQIWYELEASITMDVEWGIGVREEGE